MKSRGTHTEAEVMANRRPITIKNKNAKTCTLIDVAIPQNTNVTEQGVEHKLKY